MAHNAVEEEDPLNDERHPKCQKASEEALVGTSEI